MRHDSIFWLIWNPDSASPSTKRFASKRQADAVASKMAGQFPGEQFFVLEALDYFITPMVHYTKLK